MLKFFRRFLLKRIIRDVEKHASEVKLWKVNIPTMVCLSTLVVDNIDLLKLSQMSETRSLTELRSGFANIDEMVSWIAQFRVLVNELNMNQQPDMTTLSLFNLKEDDVKLMQFISDSSGYNVRLQDRLLKMHRDLQDILVTVNLLSESQQQYVTHRASIGIKTFLVFYDLLIWMIVHGK